jgi:prephenate dehydrogenase
MANIAIAILGLGRIGASMALALKRYNAKGGAHQFTITGYDNRPAVAKTAEKMKLADEMANKAYNAVRNKDIIVLALPYAEIQAVYELISQDLRPGVVVLDTSPLKLPSMNWAKKHLTSEAHVVGITPIVNAKYLLEASDDTEHAHDDLFDKGSMLLMPSPSSIKDAVELAADFASLLGATPHFVDPAEHDGLVAATEGLPALLGVAAFYMFSNNQGWADGQRMVNPAFGTLSHHLFDTHPDDLRDLWLKNRENMVRYIDDLMTVLRNFRSRLAEDDQAAIEAVLVDTAATYEKWINRRHNGRWDENQKPDGPNPMGDLARGFMGSYFANRLLGKKDKNED